MRKPIVFRAFVCLEVLLVVALVILLIAAAAPNLYEARTRSEVSRVRADLRSMSRALSSYVVDWLVPPPGANHLTRFGCPGYLGAMPSYANARGQCRLTTPVAYISSLPPDPFAYNVVFAFPVPQYSSLFGYNTYYCPALPKKDRDAFAAGYTWSLHSPGPSRNADRSIAGVILGVVSPYPGEVSYAYDPSNGTLSFGWIIRTNKGEFSVPEP